MPEDQSDRDFGEWVGGLIGDLFAHSRVLDGATVVFVGELPYAPRDLERLLPPSAVFSIDELPGDASPDLVVIGKSAASEALLEGCMDAANENTRFLPQEGFLDQVLFGYDWWATQRDQLDDACDYYPGLDYVRAECIEHDFAWPTVEATPVLEPRGADDKDRKQTELNRRGYNVKMTTTREDRWRTLKRILDDNEMTLEEIARTIAWYCRNFRRQFDGENRYKRALGEWEFDLQRLKATYYPTGRHRFQWPPTRP